MEEASYIITCRYVLAGSERALKGDRVSSLECHRQLLEQVDGLFDVAGDYYLFFINLTVILLTLGVELSYTPSAVLASHL